jgi:Holliday junction DNA helicase RuvA
MIASLSGKILHKEKDSLIINLSGVGLQVFVPAALSDKSAPGDTLFLHTHLVVREDSLTLFGFETHEEKDFFSLLLGVSGIGPRLSLAALSTLSPDAIRRGVFHEQPEVFSRIPGVGKKTAQKILIHLQDKIQAVDDLGPVGSMTDTDTELLEALVVLGYSVVEAQAAIQYLPKDAPEDLEVRLRLALQYFS